MVNSNVVWALVSGLAVGYIVGNVVPLHGGSALSRGGDSIKAVPGETIPAEWITEKEIGAADLFTGLTPPQRFLALKVLNSKPCDCGCPHGSIAKCKKEDPSCTDAPKEIEIAVREARAGKTYDEIYAAVQHPTVTPGAQPAGPPKWYKMPLAAWTPVTGPKYAKVTMIAFSDFECPFCSRVEPALKEIAEKYPTDVRIAWRNAPLPFHAHAMEAAEAAMAAHAQGKFWPMHDKLFANQQALDRASLDRYAKEVGLDLTKYKTSMDQHQNQQKIQDDTAAAQTAGINGTPSFFINGQFLYGAQPFDDFKKIIDAELEKANALIAAGTPMEKLYEAELNALPPPEAAAAAPAAPAVPAAPAQ